MLNVQVLRVKQATVPCRPTLGIPTSIDGFQSHPFKDCTHSGTGAALRVMSEIGTSGLCWVARKFNRPPWAQLKLECAVVQGVDGL